MSEESEFLQIVIEELEHVFDPIRHAVESRWGQRLLLDELGWNSALLLDDDVRSALTDIVALVQSVITSVETEFEDFGAVLDALQSIGSLVKSAQRIGIAAQSGQLAPIMDATAIGELASDLVALITARYLRGYHPWLYLILVALTLVEIEVPGRPQLALADGRVVRQTTPRFALRPENLPKLFANPMEHLRATHFGGPLTRTSVTAFSNRVFAHLAATLGAIGYDAVYGFPRADAVAMGVDPHDDEFVGRILGLGFTFPPLGSPDGQLHSALEVGVALLGGDEPSGPAVLIVPKGDASFSIPVGDWDLEVGLDGSLGGVVLGPNGIVLGTGSAASGRLHAGVSRANAKALVFGPASGTHLSIGSVHLRGGANFEASGVSFDLSVGAQAAKIVVSGGEGDGFLQKILPPEGFVVPFELVVGFASPNRLFFAGGAGLDVKLPVNIDLFGIIKIPVIGVHVAVVVPAGQPPSFDVAITADVVANLGPFAATVEGMGVSAALTFPTSGGNLGSANLVPKFQPPKGIGMSIKAGPVQGGGYLFLDFDAGEYAGVLQIKVGAIGLTAIGVLNTIMPDGSDGFSLVLIICADFPPIQLGYGFTLNGAGGLLGVNRTVNVPALQDGVRAGALDSLLFPRDAVANARRIINDVSAIFPPSVGQFVVGPMVKIGWGTGPMVAASIGLIIEFPRFTISLLGLIELGLPVIDSPVLLLRMAVAGILDPGRGELSIDTTLEGSRVTVFSIAGDMAMRLRWKDEPLFALAAGGFHPRFSPPAGFPSLRRLSIALANSDNPRIRLETYLALTPATVQFGARVDVYASADFGPLGFFEIGAGLSFDTLIRFSPFSFEVDISGWAYLKRNGSAFVGVSIDFHLSGPTPWRGRGVASFSLLGEHRIPFEFGPIGQSAVASAPPAVDLAAAVRAELSKAASWASMPPTDAPVRMRDPSPTADPTRVLVHPGALLVARQCVAPLGRELQKAGEAPISGERLIRFDRVVVGGVERQLSGVVTDRFASSQFFELTDDQRLTGPAFELFSSGGTVLAGDAKWGATADLANTIDDIVVDANDRQRNARGTSSSIVGLVDGLFVDARRRSDPIKTLGRGAAGVRVNEPSFGVVTSDATRNGRLVSTGQATTWIDAHLDVRTRAKAGGVTKAGLDAARSQVVALWEVAS